MRRPLSSLGTILGPSGQPVRDEVAHRRFRKEALSKAPRVLWEFPVLDGIEHRSLPLEDVMAIVRDAHVSDGEERSSDHPVHREVVRLMTAYLQNFRETLAKLQRTYNRGEMPQISVTRRPPRWPIEHVAQHLVAVAIQDAITDATEEHELLHPDPDVGRVVSLPGKGAQS